ncbi:hypothetical protein AKJ16_DCAP21016 [Drosera capensis]
MNLAAFSNSSFLHLLPEPPLPDIPSPIPISSPCPIPSTATSPIHVVNHRHSTTPPLLSARDTARHHRDPVIHQQPRRTQLRQQPPPPRNPIPSPCPILRPVVENWKGFIVVAAITWDKTGNIEGRGANVRGSRITGVGVALSTRG